MKLQHLNGTTCKTTVLKAPEPEARRVDEVRIYNRSLSGVEINKSFCVGAYRLNRSGEFGLPSWCSEYLRGYSYYWRDLRFTDSSDTLLSYWLENDKRAWINVSYLENNSNTTVYMYYGNPDAGNVSCFDSTFTRDYGETGLVGLWHMNEGSGTTLTDSSGYGNTGTFKGAGEPAWAGYDGGQWDNRSDITFSTGDSLSFDGVDDYVKIEWS